MTTVFTAHAVSVDGFITGRDPGTGRGLGNGTALFDWYGTDDARNRQMFGDLSGRVGAVVVGRNTYEDSGHFGGGSPHATAPAVILSSRPAPEITAEQMLASSIDEAIDAARALAGDKDVALMGGGVVTSALEVGQLDELVLHQVPILLGSGRPYVKTLPDHIRLELIEAVPAPGVTHLRYSVEH